MKSPSRLGRQAPLCVSDVWGARIRRPPTFAGRRTPPSRSAVHSACEGWIPRSGGPKRLEPSQAAPLDELSERRHTPASSPQPGAALASSERPVTVARGRPRQHGTREFHNKRAAQLSSKVSVARPSSTIILSVHLDYRSRRRRLIPGAPTTASKSACRFSSKTLNPALSYARGARLFPIRMPICAKRCRAFFPRPA
jgi:hypothetical protein